MTGRKMVLICRTLGVGRSSAYRESQPRPRRYARAEDRVVTAQIRSVIRTRASYGARRVHALVNRQFEAAYNLKRIRRVMEMNGWKLPRSTRRRTGRAHTGLIRRACSKERSAGSPALQGSRPGARMYSRALAGVASSSRSASRSTATTARRWRMWRPPGISSGATSSSSCSSSCSAPSSRASARARGPTAQSSGSAIMGASTRRWRRSRRRSGSTCCQAPHRRQRA